MYGFKKSIPFGCGKASNERAVLLQTTNINATIAKNSILPDLCVMILKFIAMAYEMGILFCKLFVERDGRLCASVEFSVIRALLRNNIAIVDIIIFFWPPPKQTVQK